MAVPEEVAKMEDLAVPQPEMDRVMLAAAELYGRGWSRVSVARKLEHYLLTPERRRMRKTKRRTYAMRKLRSWERLNHFRDVCWQMALQHTDTRSGAILDGVTRRAIAGRVDAAKFALEMAGRYTPRNAEQLTAVQIVVSDVPRPAIVKAEAVEARGRAQIPEEL